MHNRVLIFLTCREATFFCEFPISKTIASFKNFNSDQVIFFNYQIQSLLSITLISGGVNQDLVLSEIFMQTPILAELALQIH